MGKISYSNLLFADNNQLRLGTGSDLRIYHNGSNSFIQDSGTGDLRLMSSHLKLMDASENLVLGVQAGAVAVTGTLTVGVDDTGHDVIFYGATSGKHMHWDEDSNGGRLNLNGGADLYINQGHLHISQGSFYFKNATDGTQRHGFVADEEYAFEGVNLRIQATKKLYLDGGSDTYITENASNNLQFVVGGNQKLVLGNSISTIDSHLEFQDNYELRLGDGSDLQFVHTGTHTYMYNNTGNLEIRQNTDDGDIIFKGDDGSGGTTTYLTLDGGFSVPYVALEDSAILALGTHKDLLLTHDGTDSKIDNMNTGDLKIRNFADDKDIILMSDDGSGGTTAYITLDGSETTVNVAKKLIVDTGSDNLVAEFKSSGDSIGEIRIADSSKYTRLLTVGDTFKIMPSDGDEVFNVSDSAISVLTPLTVGVDDTGHDVKFFGATSGKYMEWDESEDALRFQDGVIAKFGTGKDLQIQHDGSNSYINANGTGDLIIKQMTADKDIIFQSDDGSGGETAYVTLDGSAARTVFSQHTEHGDNKKAFFGNSLDLQVYHDSSNSYIENGTGNLYIMARATDADISFQSDDGSGGDAEYFRLDGGNVNVVASKNFQFLDNVKAKLGSSTDMELFHNGSNSFIDNYTGDLYIRQNADDKDLIFQCDDGSGGGETYFFLDGSASSGNPVTIFPDLSGLYFGTGADCMLRHDGTDMTFQNNAGDLIISCATNDKDILLKSDDGSGGTTTYIQLDGSATTTVFYKDARFNDSIDLNFGNANDLILRHDGSNSYILNGTGDLYIKNNADDKDIIFQGDDGGGNIITALTLDMSDAGKALFNTRIQTAAVDVSDSNAVIYRNSNDLALITYAGYNIELDSAGDITLDAAGNDVLFKDAGTHIGTINMSNSDLSILSSVNDKDIIFKGKDNSSDITALTLDMSDAGTAIFNHDIKLADNNKAFFGGGTDLSIYHDGSNSYILHNGDTGNLVIQNSLDDTDIIFKCDDGSGGTTAYLTLDGGLGFTQAQKKIRFKDSVNAEFGDQGDFLIKHTGSHADLTNGTGDIRIVNNTDNGDITFDTDDGSGGVTEYFRLDGGDADGTLTYTKWADNSIVALGASKDLRIYHNGTNSIIQNYTGNLSIRNGTDDGDIIFDCDDGSGGLTTYITLDGSEARTTFSKNARFNDDVFLQIGSSADLYLVHSSGDSSIVNGVGDLYIKNGADDKDILFQNDDQSGSLATYFYLDGSVGFNRFPYPVIVEDSVNFNLGTGQDMQLLHNGSDSVIRNSTGDLYIQQNADDEDIFFMADDGTGNALTYFLLDGSAATHNGSFTTAVYTQWSDRSHIALGGAKDMQLYHDGSNSYIQQIDGATGDLIIEQGVDDGDMIFKSDDGSGGTSEYFRLDGGVTRTIFSAPITVGQDDTGYDVVFYGATSGRYMAWDESDDRLEFTDNAKIGIGSANDLQLYHDGSDSYVRGYNHDLIIMQDTADKDIKFKADNGAGGSTTYFKLDGSLATHDGSATTALHTVWSDLSRVSLGNSADLQLYHSGTNSLIANFTGDLYIQNDQDDGDIFFRSDDGSGSATTYIQIDGGNTDIDFLKNTHHLDNVYLKIGSATGGDLQIYHNGSHSLISNQTGDLYIRNQTDDGDIIFQADDGSGGDTDYVRIDGANSVVTFSKDFKAGDTVKANFGAASDLQIYHSGTQSYIDHTGTGNLYLRTPNGQSIYLQDTNGQGLAQFTDGGGSFLYHNASLRLSTTSAGITVAGGLIVADDGTIGSVSDTDAISIDDSGVVTFSSRIKANVREFEVASGSAGDAKGDIVYFGSTTSMTAGSIYHYKSDGTWELADASAVATCDGLLAVALGAASNTNGMLLRGMATLSADPGAVGDVLFVSETAGRATATAPTTNNAVVRVVGYCLHATNGNIWFNPDGTFVEVTA